MIYMAYIISSDTSCASNILQIMVSSPNCSALRPGRADRVEWPVMVFVQHSEQQRLPHAVCQLRPYAANIQTKRALQDYDDYHLAHTLDRG